MGETPPNQTPPKKMTDAPEEVSAFSTRIAKHSLVIAGHRTSISLEDAFWKGLKTIAAADQRSLASLVAQIDATRGEANLSSAIRVFVLERLCARSWITEGKAPAAGNG
jgi:predicted DNA-binding ribbon-helix-helix protein